MSVLVFIETRDGQISNVSWQAVTQAKKVADKLGALPVVGVAIGKGFDDKLGEAGKFGATKVRSLSSDGTVSAEGFARAIADEAKASNARAVLFAHTAMGKDLAPRVAARLTAGYVADVNGLDVKDGKIATRRPVYAGKLFANHLIAAPVAVVTLRPNTFSAETVSASSALVEPVPIKFDGVRDKVTAVHAASGGKIDVAQADIIVSGGRGLGNNDNFEKLLYPLAKVLGAAVGASRAVVDAGWRPHGEQVGQTGKTVSPRLYLAVGISGAIQHKAGMDSSKCIVAINKDADAPIFKFADYGVVGDVNEVVPALTKALETFLKG